MASKPGEITEEEVARIAVEIGTERTDGIVTFDELREEVPRRYPLTRADRQRSVTRPGEAMWEQKIRNIKSHYQAQGNFIYEGYLVHVRGVGYRVTDQGRKLARHAA